MRDPYREWSYDDYLDRRNDPEYRKAARRYEKDSASSDRAYKEWVNNKGFVDPVPDQRFS